MEFYLNFSLEPYGVSLFKEGEIYAKEEWVDPKQGAQIVWDFLEKHKARVEDIKRIGGISGPGGFSSLRVGGTILNTLAYKLDQPIYQARADCIVRALAEAQDFKGQLVLNSFGKSIWMIEGAAIERRELEYLSLKEKSTHTATNFIPVTKSDSFENQGLLSMEQFWQILRSVLRRTEPFPQFIPEYEYPAVKE